MAIRRQAIQRTGGAARYVAAGFPASTARSRAVRRDPCTPLFGEYAFSDIFIFAVTLGFDGDEVDATDEKGNQIPARRNATLLDPRFACLHAVNSSKGPNVGPVMPASALSAGSWSLQFTSMPGSGNPKTLSGSSCDAKVGWIVTTFDGKQLTTDSQGVVPGVIVELGNPPGAGKPCAGGIELKVPFAVDDEIQ